MREGLLGDLNQDGPLRGRPGPSPGWWAQGAGQDSLRSRALGSVLAVAPLSCPKIHLHTRGQDVALAVSKCRWLLAQQRGLSSGVCRPRRDGGPGVTSVGKCHVLEKGSFMLNSQGPWRLEISGATEVSWATRLLLPRQAVRH